jgi:Na+-driven multidrug efflux pump
VLAVALLLALVLCQLAGLAVAAGTEPALTLFGQHRDLVPLIGNYVDVRMYGVGVIMLYTALNEALKICGAKNLSLAALVLGFAVNASLDWLFLYTGLARVFASPESAIATSTVVAQAVMAGLAGVMFVIRMRERGVRLARPARVAVLSEFRSSTLGGAGVGVRHVNDYMGSVVPMMFIGTLGVRTLAAAVVAANIYTVFCRVPQACFQTTFVYYGYAVGRDGAALARRTVRTLLSYAAIPTAVAAVLVVVISPWLVAAVASHGLDLRLTTALLLAYLLYLPAYFFDQSLSTMLILHQRGALLFLSSTLATYLLTIPLAWYSVFVLHSAFLAIASNGAATAVQAAIYGRTLRSELQPRTEALVA